MPVVADIGSRSAASVLPDEPDATTARQGVAGDGQRGQTARRPASSLLGKADLVHQLRRHPLARALRVDKLTLAALEATITGPPTPTEQALRQDPKTLLARAERLAQELSGAGIAARAQRTEATVGGGGAPGKVLPSAAVTLPERYARPLRTGRPPVLPRVEQGRCVLDLAALPADSDGARDALCGGPQMHVIATAGHVDHGSPPDPQLTGMEPDRWRKKAPR